MTSPSFDEMIAQAEANGSQTDLLVQLREAAMQKQDLTAEAIEARDWSSLLMFCESQHVAETLVRAVEEHDLTDDELRPLLTEAWDRMEARGEHNPAILQMLRRVAPITEEAEIPTGTVTIYRGTLGEDPREGLCWTTDIEIAEFFCRYFTGLRARLIFGIDAEGKTPIVWQAEVDGSDILAAFGGRQESEVVPDPEKIRNVKPIRKLITVEEEKTE